MKSRLAIVLFMLSVVGFGSVAVYFNLRSLAIGRARTEFTALFSPAVQNFTGFFETPIRSLRLIADGISAQRDGIVSVDAFSRVGTASN